MTQTVAERIKNLKNYLEIRKADYEPRDNFEGAYESKTGFFKGNVIGRLEPPITTLPNGNGSGDVLDVLNSINENLKFQRLYWEKENASIGDITVQDYNEVTLPPGSMVTFSFVLNESWVFHIKKLQITYQPNTVYNFIRDGIFEPSLSEFFCDFADQYNIFSPPLKSFSQCEITAINTSAIPQVYSCWMGGFMRRYLKTSEINQAEENLVQLGVTK